MGINHKSQSSQLPDFNSGIITFFVNCALLAHIKSASVLLDISSSLFDNRTDLTSSAIPVPPGSLTKQVFIEKELSLSINNLACVDLPEPSIPSNDIKYVFSHWQALAQCSYYLNNNNYISKEYFDTSGSCKYIYYNSKQN